MGMGLLPLATTKERGRERFKILSESEESGFMRDEIILTFFPIYNMWGVYYKMPLGLSHPQIALAHAISLL